MREVIDDISSVYGGKNRGKTKFEKFIHASCDNLADTLIESKSILVTFFEGYSMFKFVEFFGVIYTKETIETNKLVGLLVGGMMLDQYSHFVKKLKNTKE